MPLLEVKQNRTNSEAKARKRKFDKTMRQRIKDIAASRDLSDDEIKPALTLKHQEIGRFCLEHGVNAEWLLEGKGRIFKKAPIVLNPNMTGGEFATVVSTLPMADQQMIRTMVRENPRRAPLMKRRRRSNPKRNRQRLAA